MNPLSVPWIQLESTFYFVIYYEFTKYCGNSLWIRYLFREFPMKSQSSSRFYYWFTFFFAKSLWLHYLFRDFAICFVISLWIHYHFLEIIINTLFIADSIWIHYLLCVSLWIHYLFLKIHLKSTFYRQITMISLSSSQNHYRYTIFSRNQYEITIYFALSLWKHYLFREFSINSLSASRFLF